MKKTYILLLSVRAVEVRNLLDQLENEKQKKKKKKKMEKNDERKKRRWRKRNGKETENGEKEMGVGGKR